MKRKSQRYWVETQAQDGGWSPVVRHAREPEGFYCKNPKCKQRHLFGVYVMAHWNEELIHTCDKCGQKHAIKRGKVRKV